MYWQVLKLLFRLSYIDWLLGQDLQLDHVAEPMYHLLMLTIVLRLYKHYIYNMDNPANTIEDLLLKIIERYYKIDKNYTIDEAYLSNRLEDYDSRDDLKILVEDKINNIMDGNIPEQNVKLSKDILEYFKRYEVRDENYLQFPNYAFNISFGRIRKCSTIDSTSNLRLVISLLTNHYTVFFEEVYLISGLQQADDLSPGTMIDTSRRMVNVLSDYNAAYDYHKVYFNKLQDLMAEHFSHYQYIHHAILFNSTIHFGAPWGTSPGFNYTVYDYLFDSNSIRGACVVYPPVSYPIG